jgi:large subunit ribosomal protein L7/L12
MSAETKGHVRIRAIDERLARLRAKRSRLAARVSHTERKRDTRRKILAGAAVLAAVEHNGIPALRNTRELLEWLDTRLTRPHDRAVFDLARRGRPSTDV